MKFKQDDNISFTIDGEDINTTVFCADGDRFNKKCPYNEFICINYVCTNQYSSGSRADCKHHKFSIQESDLKLIKPKVNKSKSRKFYF